VARIAAIATPWLAALCKTRSVRMGGLASCVVVLAASLGACVTQRDCDAVGMSSTIGIEVPVGWVVDELCIDGACQTPIDPSQPTPPDETPPPPWQIDDDPDSYTYRLSTTSPDGTSIVREGVVETEEYRVNGPGCDPVTANATLLLDDTGVVTVRNP
jgi:hypothetical protein